MRRGLKKLVIDVMDYVVGPLREYKWNMTNQMADMWVMHTCTPQCHFIFWWRWAIDEEERWREGTMTKEEYHKEVV